MESNCLEWIPVYIHSANIPISLHFLSRHSWHFRRMYMSITQLPPFLHLYTAFLVMLLLKKPAGDTVECVRTPCTSFRERRLDSDTSGYFLGMTQMSLEQRMMLCLVLLLKENYFKCVSLNNDKWELGPLLGGKTVFLVYCFHLSLLGDNYIPVSMRC